MARTAGALWTGRLLDLLTYAAAVTCVFAVAFASLGALFGVGPLSLARYALFVFGWLAFGYGTLTMRPQAPWKRGDVSSQGHGVSERPGLSRGRGFDLSLGSRGGDEETRFQAAVQRLPPARLRPLPPTERLPDGVRIFVAGLAMLGTSLAIDVLFFGLRLGLLP